METDQSIAVGIPPEEGKFCADCAHLIGVRYKKDDAENWNCGHPNNARWGEPDLVTGVKKRIFRFKIRELRYLNTVEAAQYSAVACGREGKWYKKYEGPPPPVDSSRTAEELTTEKYKPQTMSPSKLKNIKLSDL